MTDETLSQRRHDRDQGSQGLLDEQEARDAVLDGAQDAAQHPHQRRRKTLYDYIIAAGALAGALLAVVLITSYATGKLSAMLPFAMAADLEKTNKRLDTVETQLGSIRLTQLESLEIQLTDRVQTLNDKLAKMPALTVDAQDTRHEVNEAQQRLDSIRAKITKMQQDEQP